MTLEGAARHLGLVGEVKMFGSFSNGFKTGTSDLDVVFIGSVGDISSLREQLAKFATMIADFGFENVTRIFQASVPLVKFSDKRSQMEVDFCINNSLGVRNSLLLNAYCRYDERILQCGRLVKDWAKSQELVGTADGCLNSYAYMLLVIFFLQSVSPPVAPNLQSLATESVPVHDHKWGVEDCWETKFLDDTSKLEMSKNTMSTGELLVRFFHFYTCVFEWQHHAVCSRLHRPGMAVDKFSLASAASEDQWYVEDPFDLKHNLAGKCTRASKKRILDEMRNALGVIRTSGAWFEVCPHKGFDTYFLKCRISQAVTPQALLEEFEEFDLVKLHFPKTEGRHMQAFLEFGSGAARRRAHTKNECYVADSHLQLHYSSQHSLAEAMGQTTFSTYEMASYKMQRQVLAARLMGPQAEPPRSAQPTFSEQTSMNAAGNNLMARDNAPFGFFSGMPGQISGQMMQPWDQQLQAQHLQMMLLRQEQLMQHQHQQQQQQVHQLQTQVGPAETEKPTTAMRAASLKEANAVMRAEQLALKQKAAKEASGAKEKATPATATSATKTALQLQPSAPVKDDQNQDMRVDVSLRSELPSHVPVLTQTQMATVKSLQTFLHNRYRSPDRKPAPAEITVMVSLSYKNISNHIISQEQSEVLNQFQGWLNKIGVSAPA